MRRITVRTFTNQWRLKLASLALAIVLWGVVTAEQVTTQWIPVRVDAVVRDPDYLLDGGAEPATVRVRFRGPGRELWELALERPTLVLAVRNVGNARTFALDPNMVRVPEGLRGVEATDVRPGVVRLDLQRQVTRSVPVRARIGARSAERFVLQGRPSVTPSTVDLTGPEAALSAVEEVRTRAFEIVRDDSTFSQRVNLDTTGLHGIRVSTQEVRVSGRVDRRSDRAFAVMAVAVPPGYVATPAQVEVHVSGAEPVVARLTPREVRAVVSVDSIPHDLPLEGAVVPISIVGVPAGASSRAVPGRVRVTRAQDGVPAGDSAARLPAPAGRPAPPPQPNPAVPVPPTSPAAQPARPR
ncbi:MAG TPA: hypothetical protein VFJ82_00350 [Longimicrobium sp.]|nr:hypothetical protein [Longimicrobium sp.]